MAPQAPPLPTDPLTALHALSKLIDPNVKTLALVALLAGPLGIFPGIKGLPFQLASSPALLGAAVYLGGFFRPGGVAVVGNNGQQGGEGGGPSDSGGARAVLDPLGPYIKIGLLGYLFSQISYPLNLSLPLPASAPDWATWALPSAAVTLSLVLPTTSLYGPVRFACLELSRTIFSPHAHADSSPPLDWWLYPILLTAFGPALLPEFISKMGSTGSLGFALIVLVWAYHNYDAQLRAIAERVGHHASVATAAAASAREYSVSAALYEGHLLGRGITIHVREDEITTVTALGERKTAADDNQPHRDAIFEIALAADVTAKLAEQAVSTARTGDMATARQQAAAVESSANAALAIMDSIRRKMVEARDQVRTSMR